MKEGYFIDKNSNKYIEESLLEAELPEILLYDAMKYNTYPKLSYIKLLGKISSSDTGVPDRYVLDKILDNNEIHSYVVDFLCNKYIFRVY